MRLGSGEHHGWEEPRTVRLVHVFAGPNHPQEFAWLQVPLGAKGGPLDVMVRPRVAPAHWRMPTPGNRVDVASWTLRPDEVARLEASIASHPEPYWEPWKLAPDQWLFVEIGTKRHRR